MISDTGDDPLGVHQRPLDRRAFLFGAGARALDAFAGAVESLGPEPSAEADPQPPVAPIRPGHDPCLEPIPREEP